MRNIICLLLLIGSITSYSQIEKGTVLSGLRLSYSNSKAENEFSRFGGFFTSEAKTTNFSISKDVSFLITDKGAVGFGLFYNHASRETVFDDSSPAFASSEEKSNTFGLAGFYEHYIELSEKLFLSPRAQIQYGTGKIEGNLAGDYETKTSLIALSILPKINYFISSRWNLNLGIGEISYRRNTEKPVSDNFVSGEKNIQNRFSASLGAETLTLGVGYKFK